MIITKTIEFLEGQIEIHERKLLRSNDAEDRQRLEFVISETKKELEKARAEHGVNADQATSEPVTAPFEPNPPITPAEEAVSSQFSGSKDAAPESTLIEMQKPEHSKVEAEKGETSADHKEKEEKTEASMPQAGFEVEESDVSDASAKERSSKKAKDKKASKADLETEH